MLGRLQRALNILRSNSTRQNLSTNLKPSQKPFALYAASALTASTAAMALYYYDKNKTHTLITNTAIITNANNPWILPSQEFEPASHAKSQSSRNPKLKRKNFKTGQDEYFEHYQLSSREALIKELVLGTLANEIAGDCFPAIFLLETPQQHSRAAYSLLLKRPSSLPAKDLESWANYYRADHQAREFIPQKSLGLALAFDLLIGKPIQASNYQGEMNKQGCWYSIRHRDAYQEGVRWLNDDAKISAYMPNLLPNFCNQDIPNLLNNSIQSDSTNGDIKNFYKKFAELAPQDLEKIIDRFNFLTIQEKSLHMNELLSRQALVKKYLQEQAQSKTSAQSQETSTTILLASQPLVIKKV